MTPTRLLITLMLCALPALACGGRPRLEPRRMDDGGPACLTGTGGSGGVVVRLDAAPSAADAARDLGRDSAISTGGTTTSSGGAGAGTGGAGHGGATLAGTGGSTSLGGTTAAMGGRTAAGGAAGATATGGGAGIAATGGRTSGGTGGGIFATGGTGGQACPDGQQRCGSGSSARCVALNLDTDNCGTCGHACAKGDRCSYGACQPKVCSDGFTLGGLPAAATGNGPVGVVTADFDGDGKPDVALASSIAGTVSVLLGKGNGTFLAKVDYATAPSPVAIGVGDFNGDRKPDLATVSADSGTASVLLGQGDGTFASKRDYATGLGPRSLVLADLNGDGKLDVATANSAADTVSVLYGKGDGTLAPKVDYATGVYPCAVVAGDLDGDRNVDLVAVNRDTSDVSVLLGQKSGTFSTTRTATSTQHAAASHATAIGDVNGDGRLDLAIVEELGGMSLPTSVEVLYGRGDGSFSSGGEYLDWSQVRSVVLWDVNHDGRLDLAAGGDGAVSLLYGQKDGTLAGQTSYTALGSAKAVVFADFDRDGKEDLGEADDSLSSFSVRLGKGDGTFVTPVDFSAGVQPTAVAVRDLNADGILDLVTANQSSASISVLLGKGNEAFGPYAVFPTGDGPALAEPVDLDGDGRLDLVTYNSESASILLGDGHGSFSYQGDLRLGFLDGSAGGDLNGDGKLDLVTLDEGLSIRLGKGDGTFAAKQTFATAYRTGYFVRLADFNVDGKLDVLASTTDSLCVWLGRGDGTLAERVDYPAYHQPGTAVVGDLNGDGIPDVVFSDYYPANAHVRLGRGDGSFTVGESYGIWGGYGENHVLADVDGDGNLDLLVPAYGNAITVYLGAGDGTFACSLLFAGGFNASSVAVADLNGDKRLDVLTTSDRYHAVTYLPNLRL